MALAIATVNGRGLGNAKIMLYYVAIYLSLLACFTGSIVQTIWSTLKVGVPCGLQKLIKKTGL